ncbi:hypothetical protein EZV62_001546 [Acer yangbiense]|uniref:CCHC-type domain-containing protein n=1 Tax=Acer yangbiense TaxID=1000413 RepID=A0A5C7IUF7_9ROSI|nr:hypothetical protein EZV62_001546 [Acer yangbiense]
MELAKLYPNLSLAEEDGAIHGMSEEVQLDGVEDVDRCLVGKVLSGKKVNREAFKGLIEQIWNPYGNVEVELIGDNIFMFYFINREDRNRVWFRSPWHFGNSLVALEKPEGIGNISNLKFNKADFWIQIHEIPIMCMNQRTAKWMAEQIGEAVELPAESRELKLGKTEEVTVVSLKYERLLEFCFACGRIGHCNKECQDEAARKAVLYGSVNKYGSWLKASITDKSRSRGVVQGNASLSDRSKPQENSQEVE